MLRTLKDSLSDIKHRFQIFWKEEISLRPRPGSKSLPAAPFHLSAAHKDAAKIVKALEDDAIFIFDQYISTEAAKSLKQKICDAYDGKCTELRTRQSPKIAINYIDNPLCLGPEILKMALDPYLVGLVENYFQNDVYLADVDVRRILPMTMEELEHNLGPENATYSSSHWHYDVRGRQVKIMVYLNDVTPGDQNFSYCPGTHKPHPLITRSRLERDKSRFLDGWPESHGIKVVECYGRAGAAALFDTNCIHRLRRKKTNIRDTITFYYTPGQELKPLEYNQAHLSEVPTQMHRLLSGKRAY